MKAVHYGGGNIGRGFIGLLLTRSGYEVQFVDVNEKLVALLNERGEYIVELADEGRETERVRGVSALDGNDKERVAQAVAEADLVTTAVGVNVLRHIAESLAMGIQRRLSAGNAAPLHVIACENAIGGSTQLKELVYGYLPEDVRKQADQRVAFPDAAVDRIVPLQQHDDPLRVTVEPFYEWVVDGSALLGGGPAIEGVHFADRLLPYIERKLFTVNTGHCCAAYHGYWNGLKTIQEAMNDAGVADEVAGVLRETGAALCREYGFDAAEHERYISRILERFRNPYLTDEVVRVGRSPIRKLSPNDRLVRPARIALGFGIEVPYLARAMAAALRFDAPEDPEAVQLQETIRDLGVGGAVSRYTGLAEGESLHASIVAAYDEMEGRP